MTKRMLSICLAFVLLLGTLAGCSKNQDEDRQFKPEYTAGDDTGAGVSIRLSTAVF